MQPSPSEPRRANLIGERLREMRTALHLDQVDLAVALSDEFGVHLTQSDISEIERGVRGVRDFELDALARVLNTSLDMLVRGS